MIFSDLFPFILCINDMGFVSYFKSTSCNTIDPTQKIWHFGSIWCFSGTVGQVFVLLYRSFTGAHGRHFLDHKQSQRRNSTDRQTSVIPQPCSIQHLKYYMQCTDWVSLAQTCQYAHICIVSSENTLYEWYVVCYVMCRKSGHPV